MRDLPADGDARPFADLPFAAVFDAVAVGREAMGLEALESLAERLAMFQPKGWFVGRVEPRAHRWLSTVFGVYDDPSDWVEVRVSVRTWSDADRRSGADAQRLWAIWLSLEVACWCIPDHNMHPIEQVVFEVGSPAALQDACAEAMAIVDRWMAGGLGPADWWRQRAGLPLAERP